MIIFTWFNATLRNRSCVWFLALSTDEVAFAISSNSALSLVDITWMNAGTFGPDSLSYLGHWKKRNISIGLKTVTLFSCNQFCPYSDKARFTQVGIFYTTPKPQRFIRSSTFEAPRGVRQVNGKLQSGADQCATAYELLRTYCSIPYTGLTSL